MGSEPLRLEEARRMIDEAIAAASADGGPPVAVAVVDMQGALIAFARMNGARAFAARVCADKAYTAATVGRDAAVFNGVLESQNFRMSDLGDPRLIGLPGGLAIVRDGSCIGGIGVSGRAAQQDEVLAQAGLAGLGEG